jgi:hypothetical protein
MPSDNEPQIPRIQSQIIDERSGFVARDWYRFFLNLLNKAESGGGGGTVTSVNVSGGTTGLAASGGPITTSGTITLGGALNVSNGGTGAINATNARINLDVPRTDGTNATGTWTISITGNANTVTDGVYTSGSYANPTWITSLAASKLTGTVATANGGTGLSTIGTADQLLGVNSGASALEYKSLVAGANVTITPSAGTLTIASSNPGGTVTSVGLSLPSDFSVTGSPVTGSGTLTAAWASQSANLVFASPNGSSGVPTFRAIVAADVPTLNQNTTGTAANVTGVVAVANGGSGQTTAQAAMNTFAGATTSGQYLRGNGTNVVMAAIQAADVPTLNQNTTGTAANVTGTVAIANGGTGETTRQAAIDALAGAVTSGQYLRGNGADVVMSAIQAADVPTLNQNTTGTASNVTGVVAIANGGTGQTTASAAFNALSPITSTGDLILGNGTNSATRLPIGANNLVLTSNGTTAVWSAATGATITNDTSTSTNVFPTFAAATSGALSTIYTSNAKLLYKPSTGELTSSHVVASNGIFVNSLTIATSYTIPAGSSGMSAGVISVSNGVTVTVSNGSRWVVV